MANRKLGRLLNVTLLATVLTFRLVSRLLRQQEVR